MRYKVKIDLDGLNSDAGTKLRCILVLRGAVDMSLREAKEYVESLVNLDSSYLEIVVTPEQLGSLTAYLFARSEQFHAVIVRIDEYHPEPLLDLTKFSSR
jgi:hypothetical protein